jgi:hypothetical protein
MALSLCNGERVGFAGEKLMEINHNPPTRFHRDERKIILGLDRPLLNFG